MMTRWPNDLVPCLVLITSCLMCVGWPGHWNGNESAWSQTHYSGTVCLVASLATTVLVVLLLLVLLLCCTTCAQGWVPEGLFSTLRTPQRHQSLALPLTFTLTRPGLSLGIEKAWSRAQLEHPWPWSRAALVLVQEAASYLSNWGESTKKKSL